MKIPVVSKSTSIFGCLPGLTFLITSSFGFFHCYSTSSYFVPYAEAVLQVESWSSLNMIFSKFSSTFCNQSPSFGHVFIIRIRQSKKRWRRLGLLRREDVKTKLSRKKKLAPALLGLLGSDTVEGFLHPDLPFFEKHIFPPANEPREDKCENVTFGNASDLFKRFDRGLYLPIYTD